MWETVTTNEDGTHNYDQGPTIRSYVNEFVKTNLDNYLHMHKEIIPILQEKIMSAEQERKEISTIQKKTKERNKRTSVYNKKLRDCKYHYKDKLPAAKEDLREETSIFITEGDSASGTITKARNAETQAVFSLRGKPINSYKESRKKIAENEELNLLINALGLEEDIEDLRYNKIIVATDADDDGMHIRMLVLTFFMKYHPDLIRRGHLYILETPLFRVKNKNEVRYCYDQQEKEKAIKDLKTKVEITRFKGLGEISWDEFTGFIGKDMRLKQVRLGDEEPLGDIMEFYMGENTYDRQLFISRNLRTAQELEDVDF
jgi:topoisomerase-4 subunit B